MFPPVDEHLVEPEVTRDEIIGGRRVVALPAEALAAKDNPELRRREAAAEAQGIAKSILKVLERRGIAVSAEQRQEILSCIDLDRLSHWLDQAVVAATVDEILQG